MVIDDKILDQLIEYMEANNQLGFMHPSVQIGEYRGYKVRVELRDSEEEEKK
jgi:hypothetical protein